MFFAIPFFKNTAYLREALQSVQAQTDPHWTLRIFDDSIDPAQANGAKNLVAELNDSRIQYAKNPQNLGLAKNWNQILDYASTHGHTLVNILHDDDRLLPIYVESMKALAKKYPNATGYFCKCEVIGADGKKVFSLPDWYKEQIIPKAPEIVLEGIRGIGPLLHGNFIFCPSVCYNLKNLKQDRFEPEYRMVMDFEFTLRALFKGGSWVGTYQNVLYQYRRHNEAQTSKLTQNLVRYEEEMALYRKMQSELLKAGQPDLARIAGNFLSLKLNLCSQILQSVIRLRWTLTLRQLRMLWKMVM